MTSKISKKLIILALSLVLLIASAFCAATVFAKAEVDEDAISSKLKPVRETEYGDYVGLIIDGNKVYKNYVNGCVTAILGEDSAIMNARDYGGVNYNATTKKLEFLKDGDDYRLKPMILSRGVEGAVRATWSKLAEKFESTVAYNPEYALAKIYEKYAKLCDAGYNCGIATDILSVWDESVIKLDFYDGDSEYGFNANERVHVTTIAYSFLKDEAYAIEGEIFNFYRESKAGSLSEPISDTFEYTENGMKGEVQAFALGYIFRPADGGDITVRAGTRWNDETQKFEILNLDYDELTRTEMDDTAINDSPYYANKGYTMNDVLDDKGNVKKEGIKTKFYNKYLSLIDSGFNPGLPDHEGIFYWDTELLKQSYVGSDGTGNAWGRTNMMLILNPEDGNVYMVQGEILNLVDKAGHGLGTAEKLGYPLSDEKTKVINGLTYTYQNFYRPKFSDYSAIYTIENKRQLTRHITGGKFEDLISDEGQLKANNPKYFYVMEPWLISLVCVAPVVLAGAAVAVYFFVFKKKRSQGKVEPQTAPAERTEE